MYTQGRYRRRPSPSGALPTRLHERRGVQLAERLGAQSRCFIAPVGTPIDSDDWKPIGYRTLDGYMDVLRREAQALAEYSMPSRHLIGMSPEPGTLELTLSNLSPELIDLYYGTTTERSKPLGLTKDYEYPDFEGDAIKAMSIDDDIDARGAALVVSAPAGGAYVDPKHALPLAINVLGYDRPSAERFEAGPTEYNGHKANRLIPSSQSLRDANIAEAIDLLIGADIFDQREAGRAEAAAKRKAEQEAQTRAARQSSLNKAKAIFEQAAAAAALSGASAETAARVQAALSAYETARRKFEGLPH